MHLNDRKEDLNVSDASQCSVLLPAVHWNQWYNSAIM